MCPRRRHLITPLHARSLARGHLYRRRAIDAPPSLAALCVVHCNGDDGLLDSSVSHILRSLDPIYLPQHRFSMTCRGYCFRIRLEVKELEDREGREIEP